MLSIPFQISKKRLGKNDDNAKKKNWRPTPPHVDVDVETRQQRKKTKKNKPAPPPLKKKIGRKGREGGVGYRRRISKRRWAPASDYLDGTCVNVDGLHFPHDHPGLKPNKKSKKKQRDQNHETRLTLVFFILFDATAYKSVLLSVKLF